MVRRRGRRRRRPNYSTMETNLRRNSTIIQLWLTYGWMVCEWMASALVIVYSNKKNETCDVPLITWTFIFISRFIMEIPLLLIKQRNISPFVNYISSLVYYGIKVIFIMWFFVGQLWLFHNRSKCTSTSPIIWSLVLSLVVGYYLHLLIAFSYFIAIQLLERLVREQNRNEGISVDLLQTIPCVEYEEFDEEKDIVLEENVAEPSFNSEHYMKLEGDKSNEKIVKQDENNKNNNSVNIRVDHPEPSKPTSPKKKKHSQKARCAV
eukprot:UN34572